MIRRNLFWVLITASGLLVGGPAPANASSLSETTLLTTGLDGTGVDDALAMPTARAVSHDGRMTVFSTAATNQVVGDANGLSDVFTYDASTRKTELVSRTPGGQPGNGASMWPTISADGRYVAYLSAATTIVPGTSHSCTGQCGAVLVYDRTTGRTVVANVASNGAALPSPFHDKPAISANGNVVVFASPLQLNSASSSEYLYVRDLKAATTSLVSLDSNRQPIPTRSGEASLSQDGQLVTYTTVAPGVSYDTNNVNDVYVYDRSAGKISLVSVARGGLAAGDSSSSGAVISGDGTCVTFSSHAGNLVAGDKRGYRDVFVRQLATGLTTRVSVASNGTEGTLGSYDPDISQNGRFVVFGSDASNLVGGDTNQRADIFLHDRFAGITRRVNLASHDSAQANHHSDGPAISGDGKTVVLRSLAGNLITPPKQTHPNNLYRVYNPVVEIPYYDTTDILNLFGRT